MERPLVTVIIPTYNRFKYLLDAVNSVLNQTYKNIEIIVVNDCSTESEYYSYSFDKQIKIYHLPKNSKDIFGYPCGGYVRNYGCQKANGKYITFLDDDDIFLENKIKNQVDMMEYMNYFFCCTNGYIGHGTYNKNKNYVTFLESNHEKVLQKFKRIHKEHLISPKYPKMFTKEIIDIHNLIVTSSVMIDKKLFNKIGRFKAIRNGEEDYDAWKRILKKYKCYYISEPCFYYNNLHGDGKNY